MGRSSRFNLRGAATAAAIALSAVSMANAAPGVDVGLNKALRLTVSGTVASVVVGNKDIADVTVVDSHSVIVIGKVYGSTQIMAMDNAGHLLLDREINVGGPTKGQVTYYRGVEASQYACTPTCSALQTANDTAAAAAFAARGGAAAAAAAAAAGGGGSSAPAAGPGAAAAGP